MDISTNFKILVMPYIPGSCDHRISLPIRRTSSAASFRDTATARQMCVCMLVPVSIRTHRINYSGLLWKRFFSIVYK